MPRLRSPRARRGNVLLRLAALSLALLTLTGCSTTQIIDVGQPSETAEPELTRYQASFLELFDTVTTVVGYAESEEEFRAVAEELKAGLEEYHRLYDIYDEYEGINNVKTINDAAGQGPVEVDERIIDLLLFCREMYDATGGKLDVAMGGVLKLWHDAREAGEFSEDGELPDQAALEAAAENCDFDAVVIDAEAGTVEITDPETRLDVGAVAKGYATEQVCKGLPEGYLVSVGGNVRATGPKPDGTPWVVGVQDPDGGTEDYLHTLYASGGSVVTSGDYQRYYYVDGVKYHHIIDPDTLFPADRWRSVTIVCEDSGLADALSTSLFTMTQAEGQALLDEFGAEAMWVAADGEVLYSPGFAELIKE